MQNTANFIFVVFFKKIFLSFTAVISKQSAVTESVIQAYSDFICICGEWSYQGFRFTIKIHRYFHKSAFQRKIRVYINFTLHSSLSTLFLIVYCNSDVLFIFGICFFRCLFFFGIVVVINVCNGYIISESRCRHAVLEYIFISGFCLFKTEL